MKRISRALLLMLAATLALAALGVSTALAVPSFTASTTPAIIAGSTSGAEVLRTEAGVVECDTVLEGSLEATSSTLQITPTYTNCKAFGFTTGEVNPMGCGFEYHATEKVSEGIYKSHVDLLCGGTNTLTIKAPFPNPVCEAEVAQQTGKTFTLMSNSGSTVVFKTEAGSIDYTVTKDGFLCPFNGTGLKHGGELKGLVVMSRFGGGSFTLSGS
jgi:hypothetical protein